MKPFRYSMENVLEYRKNIEEEEKQKFAQIQKEYLHQKNILNDYEKRLSDAVNFQLSGTPRKVFEMKNLQQYIHFLKEKTELQRQLVLNTEEAMEARCRQLISAQKDRQIIEKHKEQALEKYNQELNQAEQKTIDELALFSHIRKQMP